MDEHIIYKMQKWGLQQLLSWKKPNQFDKLVNMDWDVLIVLDACRMDTLQRIADWPVNSVVSPASCTPEWLTSISNHEVLDGAYVVSGNPQYEKVDVELGCETIEPYWESNWNGRLQTALPEPILDRVDELLSGGYDSLVAHLQQPHWPYVAHLGGRWRLAYDELGPWTLKSKKISSVQVAMQRGVIDVENARQAYIASVRSIWNVVSEYLGNWSERGNTVVVTADHGETFGRIREYGMYEHPCGCHIDSLVSVPWIEVHPDERDYNELATVEDRLQALGYAE